MLAESLVQLLSVYVSALKPNIRGKVHFKDVQLDYNTNIPSSSPPISVIITNIKIFTLP